MSLDGLGKKHNTHVATAKPAAREIASDVRKDQNINPFSRLADLPEPKLTFSALPDKEAPYAPSAQLPDVKGFLPGLDEGAGVMGWMKSLLGLTP
jgi:hypothetical protein